MIVQLNQRIELTDIIFAMSGDEHLDARIDQHCHEPGHFTLIIWMEIQFWFINHQNIANTRLML